jgi:ABC-2 type transport system ATP-binding protein
MNVIELENISKSFKVYHDKTRTLKDKFLFKKRRGYELRQVLDGINFNIGKGESVGLIGRNGSGKSTLLKLMTKILFPTSGTLNVSGRVSSLLELGAGFQEDMSGLENVYANAAVFGLSKRETDKRLDSIIEFSELRDFIDSPVRTYSSGMYMRLAFSVAINVDADVLLIDEILAVGDAAFQAKCFNRLKNIKENGATIVIVSHSLSQIEKICQRTIWLEQGKIRMDGLPQTVHEQYESFMGVSDMDSEEKS